MPQEKELKKNIFRAILNLSCPKCNQDKALFKNLLEINDHCPNCHFDLKNHDVGDGAVFVVIFFMSFISVLFALLFEIYFEPSFLVHLLTWPIFIIFFSVFLLRYIKSYFVFLTYHHKRFDHKGNGQS